MVGRFDHCRLLAVVAHPDDESFGLGAVITTLVDAGAEISVLCLTAGEASTLGAPANLATVRAAELAAAAAVRGVQAQLLGLPDGSLAARPVAELERLVEQHLGTADALLVFEPGGVTGHPDHRAASMAGAAVAARHALPLVEWGLLSPLADRLSYEFGLRLSGLDRGADIVEMRVDRTTQWAAINEHRSQQPDNPLLRRRLTLQGDKEQIRIRPVASAMP
ncbi:MAG TPA: PIG-L deacetylase family protein [Clostridia bacterium]|nr:PIG-L deacetylase family protein [Clostridia bacterium]